MICYTSSCKSCIGVCLRGMQANSELVITETTAGLLVCLSVSFSLKWCIKATCDFVIGVHSTLHYITRYILMFSFVFDDLMVRLMILKHVDCGVKYNFYFWCRNISCNFLLANIQPCMTFIDWEAVKCSVQRWPNLFNCLAFMVCELEARILWC